MWEQVTYTACQNAETDNLVLDERIPGSDIRLSPSDFGFHNALEDKNGTLIFMDFEYAGPDHPGKIVCDLFLSAPNPDTPTVLFLYYRKNCKGSVHPDLQRRRFRHVTARI